MSAMVDNLSYVLDPDLALPQVVTKDKSDSIGPIYDQKYVDINTTYNMLDLREPGLKALDKYDVKSNIGLDAIKYLLSNLEIIRHSNIKNFNPKLTYYTVRKIIDSFTWNSLSVIRRQYYIPMLDILNERHRFGTTYAGIKIPPRGTYTAFELAEKASKVRVRGQESAIPAKSIRALLRLRDNSLLEVYDLNYDHVKRTKDTELYYKALDILETIDPALSKHYFLSQGITNELGRPAYRLPLFFTEDLLSLGQ